MSFLSEGEVIWLQECIPYTFLEWVEVELVWVVGGFEVFIIDESEVVRLGMSNIVVRH